MITIKEPVSFEWDEGNQDKNHQKHNVTQQEAEQVFSDPYKLLAKDKIHSTTEPRYIIIGETKDKRRLFIVFTLRDDTVRVISARDLNKKKEGHLYEKTA